MEFIAGMQTLFNIFKLFSATHHVNSLKQKKKHMITSMDAEKAFDKIQYPLMINNSKPEIKENFLILIHKKSTANLI